MRGDLARMRAIGVGLALGAGLLALVPVHGQDAQPGAARFLAPQAGQPEPVAPRFLAPQPAPLPLSMAGPADDPATQLRDTAQPISLAAALRLSLANNLDISQGREFVRQTSIGLDRARISFLPNFNLGSTYTHHEGTVSKTEGNIIYANKDSLAVMGGPSLNVSFANAIFAPLVARQLAAGSQAGMQRVTNDTLLAVADAYFNVLRMRRRLARIEETLDYLTSDKTTPARANSKGLLPVVQSVQLAGGAEATRAEVERVRVAVLRRQEEKAGALQDFRVAMAELARLIRLDPRIPVWPVEDFRFPMTLPGTPWFDAPLEELVRTALVNRPELAENQALIRAAVTRVKTAQVGPLLPNVVLNYNWGDYGGGPDPNPPVIVNGKSVSVSGFGPSGRILHFAPRTDFDVAMVWRLQNMGLGDLANIRQQQSLLRQAEFAQTQLRDRVVTQVVQANELVHGWRERVRVTKEALFDATGAPKGPVFRALRLNFDRIRTVPTARPLEVLDAIRGLNDTLDAYGQAITDYERARFRLLVSLGLPPRSLLPPPDEH